MAYGNYGLVVDSKFKARSFDDLIKPLAMYTQEYNALEQSINELYTKASVWENMIMSKLMKRLIVCIKTMLMI